MPAAFLLDLDGTLYTEQGPIPGAVDVVETLRHRGTPLRFITNTTRLPKRNVLVRLRNYGFGVEDDELFTPYVAATAVLADLDVTLAAPFVPPEALVDLQQIELMGGTSGRKTDRVPGAVIVGDLGPDWQPALLDEAFRYLMDGARLIALQMGRYWMGPTGLEIDAGAYVRALEYAAATTATVCGKPESPFFHAAVASLGITARRDPGEAPVAMVGDDLWNDVQGAQRAGLQGWLVRTGKYRPDALESSDVTPDRIIDSVTELAEIP